MKNFPLVVGPSASGFPGSIVGKQSYAMNEGEEPLSLTIIIMLIHISFHFF